MARNKSDAQLTAVMLSIKFDIIFGRLKPRERLIEDELIERFSISRHVVRAAFVELEQLGIVVRRPNRGTVVRDYTSREIEELYEMRAHLMKEACKRMPMPPRPELMREIEAIYDSYCNASDRGDLPAACSLNSAFHRKIWTACDNSCLSGLLDRVWSETLGIRCYGIANPRLHQQARREHAEMIAMLQAGDREGFTQLSLAHMQPALEAYKQAHGTWMGKEDNDGLAHSVTNDDAFV
jgi:DNA-binding GntR family transcriptional regulator